MSYGIYRKSELNAMVSSAGAIDIICGPLYGVLLLGPFIAAVRLIAGPVPVEAGLRGCLPSSNSGRWGA